MRLMKALRSVKVTRMTSIQPNKEHIMELKTAGERKLRMAIRRALLIEDLLKPRRLLLNLKECLLRTTECINHLNKELIAVLVMPTLNK